MRRKISWFFLVALILGTTALGQTRTLTVKLNYQGPGAVDVKHKLWVFVFDSPNFNQPGSMPLGMGSTDANGGAVKISGLTAENVYIATMYDEAGGYLAMGPPISGTPVGVHGDASGPQPVPLSGDAEVEVTFDDTFRMP